MPKLNAVNDVCERLVLRNTLAPRSVLLNVENAWWK